MVNATLSAQLLPSPHRIVSPYPESTPPLAATTTTSREKLNGKTLGRNDYTSTCNPHSSHKRTLPSSVLRQKPVHLAELSHTARSLNDQASHQLRPPHSFPTINANPTSPRRRQKVTATSTQNFCRSLAGHLYALAPWAFGSVD